LTEVAYTAKKTIKDILAAGVQLTPEALKIILSLKNPAVVLEIVEEAKKASEAVVLTRRDVEEIIRNKKSSVEGFNVQVGRKERGGVASPVIQSVLESEPNITAKDVEEDFQVILDPTSRIGSNGTLDDFIKYFRDRYMRLSNIFLRRGDIKRFYKISEIDGIKEGQIIGMVREISKTRSGAVILELEDLEASIKVMIPEDIAGKARNLMLDQVVCIEGKSNGNLFIANNILWPDVPFNHKPRRAEDPVLAVFISDTHVGSREFLEKPFRKFLEWLQGDRGDEKTRELAKRVKYLIIAGDIVDGVGVYPGQEEDLIIDELYTQYEATAKYLEDVPDYIKIIAIPGGHDATRQALPQPAIPKEYGEPLYEIGVEILGNPAHFRIHGVEVLAFHGDSLNDVLIALSIEQSQPQKAMVELLRGRHLAPIYGSTPIAPEPVDFLVIEKIPDILHCGHLHVNGQENYRGITVINSGTFQAQTSYQKSMGLTPTPGKPYIVNLQNLKVTQLEFA